MKKIMKTTKLIIHTCLVIYGNVAVGLGLILRNSIFSLFFFSRPTLYIAFLITLFAVPTTYMNIKKKRAVGDAHFIISWYISISGYWAGWLYKWLEVELLLYISLLILALPIIFRIRVLFQRLQKNKWGHPLKRGSREKTPLLPKK